MSNSFGNIFRLIDFGESHGKAMGGIIDGCPAGIIMDYDFIQDEMNRRAPTGDINSTKRKEKDIVEFLSGIYEGVTTGAPIGFMIQNEDVHKHSCHRDIVKPSHSSFTYMKKYGHFDHSGGGRASARQTVSRVVAGAVAKLILKKYEVIIESFVDEIKKDIPKEDTIGAKVKCVIKNLPAGLGEPVYDKFDARLAYAMLSINAAKGFEIGEGFKAADMLGSQYNDLQNNDFSYRSNHDGGVQAGITNGEDVYFIVAFKPIPTLQMEQQTIDFKGNTVLYKGSNRNDKCVVPRVLPIVEAMAALVTVDFLLLYEINSNFALSKIH